MLSSLRTLKLVFNFFLLFLLLKIWIFVHTFSIMAVNGRNLEILFKLTPLWSSTISACWSYRLRENFKTLNWNLYLAFRYFIFYLFQHNAIQPPSFQPGFPTVHIYMLYIWSFRFVRQINFCIFSNLFKLSAFTRIFSRKCKFLVKHWGWYLLDKSKNSNIGVKSTELRMTRHWKTELSL